MIDPYPNEPMEVDFAIPESYDELVYRSDRYVEEYSPKVLYIPSKLILFKLMRACIGITKKDQLWFRHTEKNKSWVGKKDLL